MHTEVTEFLLSFGAAASCVFQFAVQKIYRFRYTELQFLLLFCMGVKRGQNNKKKD